MEERIGWIARNWKEVHIVEVLILIVVEERIGYRQLINMLCNKAESLNPYCSGRKNRML